MNSPIGALRALGGRRYWKSIPPLCLVDHCAMYSTKYTRKRQVDLEDAAFDNTWHRLQNFVSHDQTCVTIEGVLIAGNCSGK